MRSGRMGHSWFRGSHVMDLPDGDWNHDGRVRYRHDARILPWPVPDGFYRLVVALRVWHRLYPRQRECFMEALRISDHVLIVCPEKEVVGKGIPAEDWHLARWTALDRGQDRRLGSALLVEEAMKDVTVCCAPPGELLRPRICGDPALDGEAQS